MSTLKLSNCKLIGLPTVRDPRGNLTYIEGSQTIPFVINRTYYLYDLPAGTERGGHAHKTLQQLLVAVSGSFDVVLDDGRAKEVVTLNRPYCGLYVGPMVWREMQNFSSGAVCLVLASKHYSEDDYIRDYHNFVKNNDRD